MSSFHSSFLCPASEYNMIKDQPGDAYFVRSMFDRNPVDDYGDPPHLTFAKDDILYIDK